MKPLNCQILDRVQVALDENIEEEREIMLLSPIRKKEVEQWNNGILLEIQPVTSKYVNEGYHNEQTAFYGIVWDSTDLKMKTLSLSDIKVEAKEMDRVMRKEWS